MNPKTWAAILVAVSFECAGQAAAVRADFVVFDWRLSSAAFDFAQGQFDEVRNVVVENPFNQSLNATFNNSIAHAAYQYNWNLATGQFGASIHLEGQGGSNFGVSNDNLVRITTTTDVLLHAEGQWTYAIPGGFRTTEFNMRVGKVPHDNAFFFIDGGAASPGLGDPASGTFTANLDVLLPAGGTYFFRSIFDFNASSGSPTALSIGSGYANFTLTSIPEPATLGSLALAALLVRKPRRRRSATS